MDLLVVAVPTYDDDDARDWHPDLRRSVGHWRREGLAVDFVAAGRQARPVVEQALRSRPRSVFIDAGEENLDTALAIARALHAAQPALPILLGGVPATLRGGDLLAAQPALAALVVGEREQPVLAWCRRQGDGVPAAAIAGLRTRSVDGGRAQPLADLDQLFPMAWDGLADGLGELPPAERTAWLTSSRGCYGHCGFCGVPGLYAAADGRPWRAASASVVVDEIEGLVQRFGVRRFVFQDDEFMGPGARGRARAIALADEIRRRALDVSFHICCRLNDLDRSTLEVLADAGLAGLGVSIESNRQASLDLYRKGLRAERIEPTLAMLEELGIPTEVNMIFFDPLLDLDGVRGHLDLLERIAASRTLAYSDSFPFNELRLFAWTPVNARLREAGLLREGSCHWTYADARVARLADFVRDLRSWLPLDFKRRQPFAQARARLQEGTAQWLVCGLRHWIGLVVLPPALRKACDIVEAGEQVPARLGELEAELRQRLAIVARANDAVATA